MSLTRHARNVAAFALGLALGGYAVFSHAGYAQLIPPANVGGSPGAYVIKGAAAFSGAAFNSGFTTQVAGKMVTVPAKWRLAANAGRFALGAVRLTPTGLIGGAIASYLLTKGLQWIGDKWMANPDTNGDMNNYQWWFGSGGCTASAVQSQLVQGSLASVCGQAQALIQAANNCGNTVTTQVQASPPGCRLQIANANGVWYNTGFLVSTNGKLQPQPATDADWEPALSAPLPDDVATELASKPQPLPLPLQDPIIDPTPQSVPLSDPYIDPLTGKRVKDVAKITPQPSSPDKAIVDVVKEEVDEAGNPVVNADGTKPAPTKQDDPCVANPDRLGCLKTDIPEAPDITNNDKTISITPDSGWGPDSGTCPVDRVTPLKLGGNFVVEFGPACSVATGFRPIVIGFAWVGAVLIAIGITKRYG